MAVSAESMTASVPSKTALATSEASALVGRRCWVIDSNICVAVITSRRRRFGFGDDTLLKDGHRFRAHFHAEVAARDHDAVRLFQNRIQAGDRLGPFNFCDDRQFTAASGDQFSRRCDVLRPRTNERAR